MRLKGLWESYSNFWRNLWGLHWITSLSDTCFYFTWRQQMLFTLAPPNNSHSIVPFRWNNTIIWISVWIQFSRVSIHNIWIYLRKISPQCNYWNNLRLRLGEFELFLWGYFSPKIPVTVGTEQAHKLLTLNKGSQFSKRAV